MATKKSSSESTASKAAKAKSTAKGLPDFPNVSSRALSGLAAKVKKGKDHWKKAEAIDSLVDYSERAAFYWALLRHEIVPFWEENDLWSKLRDLRKSNPSVASPGDVAFFLSKVTLDSAGLEASSSPALPSWPPMLDDLVLPAYLEDPSAFAGWEAWPEAVREGFATVLARAGALPKDKLGADFVHRFARLHIKGNYGLYTHQKSIKDGKIQEYTIYDQHFRPSQDFYSFVETVTTKEAFLDALDQEASKPEVVSQLRDGLITQKIDVLRRAPISRLAQHLDKCNFQEPRVERLHTLFMERNDPPADLFGLARLLSQPWQQMASEIALVRGVLRAAERREAIPESVDDLFQFQGLQTPSDPLAFVSGVAELVQALRALGRDRARKVIARMINDKYHYANAFSVLHAFAEERDLVDEAFKRFQTESPQSDRYASGMPLFPPSALPMLVEKYDVMVAKGGEVRQELVCRGLQGVLARAAKAGVSWDSQYDRFLTVHGFEKGLDGKPLSNLDRDYHDQVGPVVRAAVAGLTPERKRAWLAANLDAEKPGFARVIHALPRDDHALISEALAFIAQHHERVRMTHRDWLKELASDLGDAALPHVRAVLQVSQSPRLRKSFDEALGVDKVTEALESAGVAEVKQETTAEKIQRLAKGLEGPTEPITLLERLDLDDDETLDAISRVGGPGFDLGDRQPKHEDEPMTHIFTLATDDVPSLRGVVPNAEAMALYVANPDMNEAYKPYNEETSVVFLTAEDVQRGLAQPTSKDLTLAAVKATTLDVPVAAVGGDDGAKELHGAIYQLGARAGGDPIWLQDEEDGGRFLLQVDESFASMNLGDCGVMYVFDDTAFWQCH